ncbi:MAG: glycosyltransferase family 4 protein [Lachnospiraceae bacterium]|nr:glycosyltransferase family 4 protein [Lachnospiraceae bacterium]
MNDIQLPLYGRLLYVGSMVKRKGLDLLMDALKFVKQDFRLRIVGNGSENEVSEIRQLARSNGIENKIEFCGFKQGNDLIREYKDADIFIFPTREDCFGLVLVEALCAGVPIISSKYADGAYDVIEEGKNGLLVNPYDAEEFGKKIEDVLNGTIHLEGADRALVEKFSFENAVKGYLDAIDFVMREGAN